MQYFLLLAFKLIVFMILTEVSYAPWLAFAIDMVFVSLLSFLFFREEKWAKRTSSALYWLITAILVVDTAYYFYFGRLPVAKELSHAGNVGDVTDALGLVLKPALLWYFIDWPINLIKWISRNKRYIKRFFVNFGKAFKRTYIDFVGNTKRILRSFNIKNPGRDLTSAYRFLTICLAIFITLIFVGAPFMNGASHQSLFAYHTMDLAGAIEEKPMEITESDITEVIETESHDNEFTGVGAGKNLIIIQVESLNNFVINKKYNDQEITPNLNALINGPGSIYASDYYEVLGAGNTSDAEFVSLHSMYPSMKNPSYEVYLDTYLYGLPMILKDQGYNPLALHGYRRDFWIRDRAYPHIGFDKFYAEDNYEIDEVIGMGLGDKSFLKQSASKIENEESPFFAFLVTLTSHVPYEMPAEEQKLAIDEEDSKSIFGKYLQAVHYTDAAIGEFISDLKAKGLYDNSIIVIYGDHHGFTGMDKAVNDRIAEFTGIDFDFDTLLNIPLIIHVGGQDFNKQIDSVRSQIDLAPTLLNIMGIDYSKYILMGEDIMDENHYATLYPQAYMLKGSFINDDYIFTMKRDGIFENGSLKNRHSRQLEDVSAAKSLHQEGIRRINMSKTILENDLIKQMMSGENLDHIESDKQKLKNAIEVKDSYQLLRAYEAGFDTFKINLYKTEDDYYVSREDAGNFKLNEIGGNVISLGDIVSRYTDLNFIVKVENIPEFANRVRQIPGLQKNIIIEVDNLEDYGKISAKQNGYKIMFTQGDIEPNKLISMSELNSDLIFYNNPYPELEQITYFPFSQQVSHQNVIFTYDQADIKKVRDFDVNYEINILDIIKRKSPYTLEELLKREDKTPIMVDFEYDIFDGKAFVSGIFKEDGSKFTLSDLDELLKANKNLNIAIGSSINLYEIYSSVAASHTDLTRIIPTTDQAWALMHPAKLGYKDSAYIGDGSVESFEIIKLYKSSKANIIEK